ncbi:MAG: HU family DNA-binding protein [bacterium]|nr:HU family DNA-binding protein [bacterium]
MNNRITFPELVEQVAQCANTSKRMSELFLKELFATISQSLINGESVKVKGIGSFKLTEVSPRKSVNVNTGEEINIPGHKKLSFAPDKDLAQAVNQPFSHFETVILEDGVTDEQLAQIDAYEAETPQAPDAELPTAPEAPATDTDTEVPPPFVPADTLPEPEFVAIEEATEAEEAPAAEAEPEEATAIEAEPEETPAIEAEADEAPAAEAEADEAPAVEEEPEMPVAAEEMESMVSDELSEDRLEEEKDKRRITRRSLFEGFIVGVITTLIVTLFSYRLYLMKCPDQADKPTQEETLAQAPTADSVATPAETTPAKVDSAQLLAEQKAAEEAQKAEEAKKKEEEAKKKAEAEAEKQQAAPKGVNASQDTVRIGTTLFKLSKKHYGSDKFWVYIYEENKAKYPNPNSIPVGAVLRIPALSKYGATAGDPASFNAAKKKETEIYNSLNKKR